MRSCSRLSRLSLVRTACRSCSHAWSFESTCSSGLSSHRNIYTRWPGSSANIPSSIRWPSGPCFGEEVDRRSGGFPQRLIIVGHAHKWPCWCPFCCVDTQNPSKKCPIPLRSSTAKTFETSVGRSQYVPIQQLGVRNSHWSGRTITMAPFSGSMPNTSYACPWPEL